MAINPIHVPRVSFGLRTQTLLEQLTRNQGRLFFEEQRVATGRALLSASDDPIAAGKVVRLSDRLVRQDQILANLQHADRWLTAGESAVTNIADLLIEAKSIALEQVNSFQTSEQRASAAIIVDGIIDQLITVGNQQFAGRYLFGGRRTTEAPFDTLLGRAQFVGDRGDRNTVVDFGLERPFNLPADQLFGLTDDILPGSVLDTGGYFSRGFTYQGHLSELMPRVPDGAFGKRARTRCRMLSVRSCSPAEMKILVPLTA